MSAEFYASIADIEKADPQSVPPLWVNPQNITKIDKAKKAFLKMGTITWSGPSTEAYWKANRRRKNLLLDFLIYYLKFFVSFDLSSYQ